MNALNPYMNALNPYMNALTQSMDLCEYLDSSRLNSNLYFKVNANNTDVFVLKSTLSEAIMAQIISVPKVMIPKMKIRWNENNYIYTNDSNKAIRRHDSNTCFTNNTNTFCKSQLISRDIKRDNNSLKNLNLSNTLMKDKRRLNTKRDDMQLCNENKKIKSICYQNSCNQEMFKENNNGIQVSNSDLCRGIGLPNMGNTCYLNCIIQVLRITPGFTQFICFLNQSLKTNKNAFKLNKENKELILSLHELFVYLGNKLNIMIKSHESLDSKIRSLIKCQNLKERFEFGQQHDSHEFLNWLINELNNYAEVLFPSQVNRELNSFNTKSSQKVKRNGVTSRTITFQSFQGVMLRNIECTECKTSSFTDDSFADIQIPLCLNEEDSLQDNDNENIANICELPSFSDIIHRTDYLKDDNKFDCDNCSKKTVASVIHSIKISPKILVIFIKKPLEYRISEKSKTQQKIFKVPLHLEYASNEHLVNYELYAFVMHDGSTVHNGHYYTVISSEAKNDKTISTRKNNCSCAQTIAPNIGWIKVNDDKARKLNSSHVIKLLEHENISSTPYLAFYKQK